MFYFFSLSTTLPSHSFSRFPMNIFFKSFFSAQSLFSSLFQCFFITSPNERALDINPNTILLLSLLPSLFLSQMNHRKCRFWTKAREREREGKESLFSERFQPETNQSKASNSNSNMKKIERKMRENENAHSKRI